MTDTLRTPPPTAAGQHRRPFTLDPSRWEAERSRALRTGHVRDHTCTAECEPVLVYERTRWGWLAWTVPGDGTPPEQPHQIGVLTPTVNRMQRLALRWLTRHPAQRLALVPGSLGLSAAAVALISLLVGLLAMGHGVPIEAALPGMVLAPLLAEHLPRQLDARAREHVRGVEGDGACQYLQRLAALHTSLVQAAADSDRYELHRAAEIGQHTLWDAAGLLQTQDTRSASAELIARERLMVQLADQAAQTLKRTHTEDGPADTGHTRERPLGPYPPGPEQTTRPTPHHTHDTSPLKGHHPMTQPDHAVRTADVYLLFAHELYYPGPGAQEINTTLVAAATLLHPRVRQPDGAQIHDRLTQGRRPEESIPLATLTHELNGGTDWPTAGDWESVTTDLLQLVREGECDALSLGLPEIPRALICTGPHSHVRTYDAAADQFIAYGPTERAAVLAEVDTFLAPLVAGSGAPAAVFHKDDLRTESAGDTFGPALTQALTDGHTHVAVVLNAIDDRLAKEQKLGDGAWHVDDVPGLRDLLCIAAAQGMAVLVTSDHGHVIDRHGTKTDTTVDPASARHRPPGTSPLAEQEIALSGPRVVWPEPGASIVALWDADSRYTALKAGYHGGASLAEFTIPVLAFLPFGAEPPKDWRELGDQRPTWWAPQEAARLLPGERTLQAAGTAPAAAPKKTTAKTQKKQAELARTHDALFDVELTAGGDDALLTPTLVSRTETLVTALLDSETYQAQIGGLARKPQQEQVHKALTALLDAGGTLPVTPLARRAGMPTTRGDGFAAVLRQLLNYDGVQVLETLPDGRTLRLHEPLLREQFALGAV
ncbi:BREX-2 system phosphatase PglZ [Streptomyces mirabilis]|uniref:BREX-2 system phosphatase PglZ n=1 Tax=Streptomyces mirabilis TaxID=68239 RepID=UPI0036B0208E